jgi:hypothetical protein
VTKPFKAKKSGPWIQVFRLSTMHIRVHYLFSVR